MNLTPGIDANKFNVKYLLTTLLVVVIIAFAFSAIVRPSIVMDSTGKAGEIKFKLKKFNKL